MHSTWALLFAYLLAAAAITITPGLDTALVLRTSATEGPRKAFLASLGIAAGCLVWTAIVACGLSAVLLASRFTYDALRWIGATYLLFLGLKLLRKSRKPSVINVATRNQDRGAFFRGALTNLLNPKVGVFYVSFLPQFVPVNVAPGPFMLLLGAIHALLGLAWFFALITALRSMTEWLHRPSVKRWLDRATGAVFISFSVRLAIESRRS